MNSALGQLSRVNLHNQASAIPKPIVQHLYRSSLVRIVCSCVFMLFLSVQSLMAQAICLVPCDLPSEISQTTDFNSLQGPPGGIGGVTGGCGFGTVTATNGECTVDATHKWSCSVNATASGHYSPMVTYTPGPVPAGCTYPDPASTSNTGVYVDAVPPTVSVTSPQSGAWVRREAYMSGEAQDDMQLFHVGAISCKDPGCGSTGAFSFPGAAGIEDFKSDIYYNDEKLKSAEWSVPLSGIITCGKNPQTAIVEVRDSVFHITEESISFYADCYPPEVSITEPPMYGNSWTDPQKPVIKGTASDDGEIDFVAVIIYDETAKRYWNGSEWQASLVDHLVALNGDGEWQYAGLTKEDLNSTNYKIIALAKDVVGRTGGTQATVGYKKRLSLGKKDFTNYTIAVKEVKNIARADAVDSFVTKEGENIIGVTAAISPVRLSAVLSSYVKWDVVGANSVSGNPFSVLAGNPSRFYARIPPILAKTEGRGAPLAYNAFSRLEYDYDGVSTKVSATNHRAIAQDQIDQCRQEYIDMSKWKKPNRSNFINATSYHNPGNFSFSEIKTDDYDWAIFNIASNLQNVRNDYNDPMPVVSGYRNPTFNASLGNSGTNSPHIYGEAADIGVGSMLDWVYLCRVAVRQGACVEPYSLTGSWVHMDWRTYVACGINWPNEDESMCDEMQ